MRGQGGIEYLMMIVVGLIIVVAVLLAINTLLASPEEQKDVQVDMLVAGEQNIWLKDYTIAYNGKTENAPGAISYYSTGVMEKGSIVDASVVSADSVAIFMFQGGYELNMSQSTNNMWLRTSDDRWLEYTSSRVCGNGEVDIGEECDDGKTGGNCDDCTDNCQVPRCGDGFICAPEECDGNDNFCPVGSYGTRVCTSSCVFDNSDCKECKQDSHCPTGEVCINGICYSNSIKECQDITSPDNYSLKNDITANGDCLILNEGSDGSTLNCNDYKLTGTNLGSALKIKKRVENITIENCEVSGFDIAVNALSDVVNLKIINNTFAYNWGVAVDIDRTTKAVELIGNNISYNLDLGVVFSDNPDFKIIGNTITNNDKGGVDVSGINCEISGNEINDNSQLGILLNDGGDCLIMDNNISGNLREGLRIRSSPNLVLQNNNISLNQMDGLFMDNSGNCFILNNNIRYSGDGGFILRNSDGCDIQGNLISNSGENGIQIESTGTTLNENNISNNDWNGILVTQLDNIFVGNTVRNNKYGGVLVDGELVAKFDGNIICKNNGLGSHYDIECGAPQSGSSTYGTIDVDGCSLTLDGSC